MRILITGASGLIGTELSQALKAKGHTITGIGRREWPNPAGSPPPRAALETDAVVHLMGENVAGRRWNEEYKRKLRDSRILTTGNLVKAMRPSQTLVCASGIGYYGERGDEALSENSAPGTDFLARLCLEWEGEARKAKGRSVQVRTGLVLSPHGGALAKMLPVFKAGLGGRLDSGRQWMSWIHMQDLIRIYTAAIEDPNLSGPVNGVSPKPVRNAEFTKILAKQLHRPALFPVPRFALNLALGEMAPFVLASQKVLPEKFADFRFPGLKEALADLLP